MKKTLKVIFFICLFFLFSCDNKTTVKTDDDEQQTDDSANQQEDDSVSETTDDDQVEVSGVKCKIPDTGQKYCFDTGNALNCPEGGDYFGQDAQYLGFEMKYQDNGDDTITDLVTGLEWTKGFFETSFDDAKEMAENLNIGGHSDWRVPSIKELYSLMNFNGSTGSGQQDELSVPSNANPFIDTTFFDFEYGQVNRFIDAQYVTDTVYVGTVFGDQEAFFGLNLADGRIKGYPTQRMQMGYYARFVRGRSDYGESDFADNGDETVTDKNTGLTWMKKDNGAYGVGHGTYGGLLWAEALKYCEDLELAGKSDWRLPNAKELQYIVDYSRSPTTTNSPAIDPIFETTQITVEDGSKNYPFFWTSTTHVEGNGEKGAYIAFGQAFGFPSENGMDGTFLDVHGAGCQRSDPKTGDPSDYPTGFGPQGDVLRIYNFVRCVRSDIEMNKNTAPASDFTTEMEDAWNENNTETPDDSEVPDDNVVGPVTCEKDEDCEVEGACPLEATLGCGCGSTPQGNLCIPKCNTDEDCPTDMTGTAMTCMDNFCVPAGAPPRL